RGCALEIRSGHGTANRPELQCAAPFRIDLHHQRRRAGHPLLCTGAEGAQREWRPSPIEWCRAACKSGIGQLKRSSVRRAFLPVTSVVMREMGKQLVSSIERILYIGRIVRLDKDIFRRVSIKVEPPEDTPLEALDIER